LKRTHLSTLSAVTLAAFVATACTNSDDPQASMCQAVAQELTQNSISEWGNISKSDGDRIVTSKVAFTTNTGQSATIDCQYKKHRNTGAVDSGPYKVAVNGQEIPNNILIPASLKATKVLLAGTYKNTVAKSQELAAEAGAVAGVALDSAGKVANEVLGEVQGEIEKALQTGNVLNTDK